MSLTAQRLARVLPMVLLLATPRAALAQLHDPVDNDHPDSPSAGPAEGDPEPTPLLFELYLGPSWRYLAEESFVSGRGGFVLGGRSMQKGFSMGVRLEGEYGSTVRGLRFGGFGGGPSMEFRVKPGLHVEVTAPHFDGIFIQRVTSSEPIIGFTIGASAALAIDLWGGADGDNGLFLVRASLGGGNGGVSGTLLVAFGWRL